MLLRSHWLLSAALLIGLTPPTPAHFHMLLPDDGGSVARGLGVSIWFRWGHPFEHQLFDAALPERFYALAPDGTKIDLLSSLEKDSSGSKAAAYRLLFIPKQRGDYVLVAHSAPVWMEEDREFFHDTVKVILHVQAQKGWDQKTGEAFDLRPLTRPYGLETGMVMTAQAQVDGKPLPDSLVEIERYNPAPPASLPAEEFITRTAKTDPNGVVLATLPAEGWWCLTAQRLAGTRAHNGKDYSVRQRATLWVYVAGKSK